MATRVRSNSRTKKTGGGTNSLHASVVTLQSQELLDYLQKTTDADINGATSTADVTVPHRADTFSVVAQPYSNTECIRTMWNRDVNASVNTLQLLMVWIRGGTQAVTFRRNGSLDLQDKIAPTDETQYPREVLGLCLAANRPKSPIAMFRSSALVPQQSLRNANGSQLHVPKNALIGRAWSNAWIIVKQGCVRPHNALKCSDMHLAGYYSPGKQKLLTRPLLGNTHSVWC